MNLLGRRGGLDGAGMDGDGGGEEAVLAVRGRASGVLAGWLGGGLEQSGRAGAEIAETQRMREDERVAG